MTNPGPTAISGSTTLNWRDNNNILLHQLPMQAPRIVALVLAVFVIAGAVGIALDDRLSFAAEPYRAISVAAQELWPFAAGSFLLLITIILLLNFIRWMRFPEANKSVSYIADAEGVTTSDAVGASVRVPWKMVKTSRRTRDLIMLRLNTGGLRVLPLRAFTPGDAESLWLLVEEKTPAK